MLDRRLNGFAAMHLQQTKLGSRRSGGPQYYFHDVPEIVKEFLRNGGHCPVLLTTPYGIAKASFLAVGRDTKIDERGRVTPGRVGHDRIQQGPDARMSIGEAIREWYALPAGDFERIDVEVRLHNEGHFILTPTKVTLRGRRRSRMLRRPERPLSCHRHFISREWQEQIDRACRSDPSVIAWAAEQVQRVVRDHHPTPTANVGEADLLRAAGALSKLGLDLGPYLLGGYDCQASSFSFADYRAYPCPVEVKKRSKDLSYQIATYKELPRVVVLCMTHDLENPPEDVDILELTTMAKRLAEARG